MKRREKLKLIVMLIISLVIIPISEANAETRNNNPLLREILIDGEAIEPEFDQFITEYVLTTEKEKINIQAEPDDSNATVEIIGNDALEIGVNNIEIKVIAEDQKTTQSYYLHVTRGDTKKANANLSNLEIEGITLNPRFNNKDIKYYVEYEGFIDNLNITATPESENAKIEIEGNDNFNTGTTHVVKIKVTAEDGITTKVYQIVAKKAGEDIENPSGLEELENEITQVEENKSKSERNKNIMIVPIAIVIICILVLGIIKITLKKKESK